VNAERHSGGGPSGNPILVRLWAVGMHYDVVAPEALNLSVIAESVEAEAQRSFLQSCKCDEIQGYSFSEPLQARILRARCERTNGRIWQVRLRNRLN
jgi:hypothetical protein